MQIYLKLWSFILKNNITNKKGRQKGGRMKRNGGKMIRNGGRMRRGR